MMNRKVYRAALSSTVAAAALMALAAPVAAVAQSATYSFDIPSQDLGPALLAFGKASRQQLVFDGQATRGKQSVALAGNFTTEDALRRMLDGTGLRAEFVGAGAVRIVAPADGPQGASAGGGAETNVVQELVVTAQKRSENIQVVPIAISAFTQADLTTRQIAGGPDLITQVPNMTFTKTNFSSYSIQIRGIGTQAISATTDPAVAVAFNNTPFVRNRFFEQEFYDLERVEVLRGPQGTLYGRNATAGVVNILSAKPTFEYEAKGSADVGNFNSRRLEGMLNVPLVDDKVALRLAGAWTKRDGYATNQLTGNPIDGRDLWSTRVSLRVEPTDKIRGTLIWEHFQEGDDRLRSGKQLCKKDVVTEVNGFPVTELQTLPEIGQESLFSGVQATFSQGCARTSLYSPESFQTPVGLMLPYYAPLGGIGLPVALADPYVSRVQSPDLRVIESAIDPRYSAKADLGELQFSVDVGSLTFTSETSYSADTVFSLQDFNRFNTAPGAWLQPGAITQPRPGVMQAGPNGGVFCDPQLGCSDRMLAVDISTADSNQFSQEFRVSSNFAGRFNFSLGANFLRYDTEDKYYVFINSLSLISALGSTGNTNPPYVGGVSDNVECLPGAGYGDPNDVYSVNGCVYIDPNPIGNLNDHGHNYFLSRNPYKLISYAAFGEAYYNITDNLKLTGGLRWTVDKKDAPRIPTWVLAIDSAGYPVAEVVEQEWREPTGRLAIDWKPDLGFTDQTLLYASYAHGYKAGGANPPGFVRVFYSNISVARANAAASATRPKTFDPEFINAFELGSKNTLLDGSLTVNLAAFYYDYTGYQVSEIVDRSAFNRNFDAKVWGVEIESDWRPLKNLRLGFKGGYEKTRINDGMQAVDLMDRTAGHTDWMLVRPFPTYASSCVLPSYLFVGHPNGGPLQPVDVGGVGGGNAGGCELAYEFGVDPVTHLPYVANPTEGAPGDNSLDWYTNYPGFNPNDESQGHNHGEGFYKQLGGNELPNAPHWTATITGDYTIPLPYNWLATLHTDVHWQSQSWWRVFNDNAFDKLHPYFTMNLAAIFTNEEAGWNVMAYIKNVTDETAITGAFLNSDDTGLTTNVFLTEPRLYGVRVTKTWTGSSSIGRLGELSKGPGRFRLELGGQAQEFGAPNAQIAPDFMAMFPSPLDPRRLQDKGFGRNGGGEVKLSYTPSPGWDVSIGHRFGKTKHSDNVLQSQLDGPGCWYGPRSCQRDPKYIVKLKDWAQSDITEREEFSITDFSVGREVGLGMLTSSKLSAGLRIAQFKSSTNHKLDGTPQWDFPELFAKYYNEQHHRYQATLGADREFKGVGPAISWDAAQRLVALGDLGEIDLDWSVSGGVLFGKQKSAINGSVTDSYYDERYINFYLGTPAGPVSVKHDDFAYRRSHNAQVPLLDASMGLTYSVGTIKLGGGYRWERYFDAIDGGFTEKKRYDRTIQGPYFKVSVGFGG